MENKKRFGGKLFPLTFITLICLAVLWQCSGETKTAGDAADAAGDAVAEAAGDMADAAGDMADAAADAAGEVSDAMENSATDGDLEFDEGSWAWTIQNYLSTGSGESSFTLDKIPYDSEEVSAEGKEQLDNLAALLKAYPDMKVLVKGHSRVGDNAAEKTANKVSSKARALWAQGKLASRGVSGSQMKAKGIGGGEPLSDVDGKDMTQRRISIQFEQ